MDITSFIKIAKLISIVPSLILSGYCFMGSQNTLPALYDLRPQISTPFFANYTFHRGGQAAVPLAIVSSTSYAFLIYADPEHRAVWTAATAAVVSMLLFTGKVMMEGIQRLEEISRDERLQRKSEQTLEHRQLLKKWAAGNFVRSALMFGAGVAGLWVSI